MWGRGRRRLWRGVGGGSRVRDPSGQACLTRPARKGREPVEVPAQPCVDERRRRSSPLTSRPSLAHCARGDGGRQRGGGEGCPTACEQLGGRLSHRKARKGDACAAPKRKTRTRHAAPRHGNACEVSITPTETGAIGCRWSLMCRPTAASRPPSPRERSGVPEPSGR